MRYYLFLMVRQTITCKFMDKSKEPCNQIPIIKKDKRVKLCYYHHKVKLELLETETEFVSALKIKKKPPPLLDPDVAFVV